MAARMRFFGGGVKVSVFVEQFAGERDTSWAVVFFFFLNSASHVVQKAGHFGFMGIVLLALGDKTCECGNTKGVFFVVSGVGAFLK